MNPAACVPIITDTQAVANAIEHVGVLGVLVLFMWVMFRR